MKSIEIGIQAQNDSLNKQRLILGDHTSAIVKAFNQTSLQVSSFHASWLNAEHQRRADQKWLWEWAWRVIIVLMLAFLIVAVLVK